MSPAVDGTVPRLVLASRSPARLATLRAAGLDPEVIVSGVDEDAISAPDTATLVARLAQAKAEAVAGELEGDVLVIGCDSLLDFDGESHGKPTDAAEARARWHRMSGGSGALLTGHHVIARRGGTEQTRTAVARTTVEFATLTDDELDAYIATGEPLAVAGAFTIDSLGGAYVRSLTGDHHNVVGISLPLLRELLAELGIAWHSLWKR